MEVGTANAVRVTQNGLCTGLSVQGVYATIVELNPL